MLPDGAQAKIRAVCVERIVLQIYGNLVKSRGTGLITQHQHLYHAVKGSGLGQCDRGSSIADCVAVGIGQQEHIVHVDLDAGYHSHAVGLDVYHEIFSLIGKTKLLILLAGSNRGQPT